ATSRSEWATLMSRTSSATSRSPSTSATPPASVEVSRASTRIAGSLARALKGPADPCDNGRREDPDERRAEEGSRRRRGRGSREDPPRDPQAHRRLSRQRSRAPALRPAHQRVHREDAGDDGAVVHRGTRRGDRDTLRSVAGGQSRGHAVSHLPPRGGPPLPKGHPTHRGVREAPDPQKSLRRAGASRLLGSRHEPCFGYHLNPARDRGFRRPPPMKALAVLTLALTLAVSAPAFAEPIAVQFTEGVSHAFPVLRSVGGEKLAQGEWLQIARGDRVENRLTFRFRDGSLYDERVVFSQKDTFTLVSYQLVQKGPSFPESIDAKVDRETGRYEVRYK